MFLFLNFYVKFLILQKKKLLKKVTYDFCEKFGHSSLTDLEASIDEQNEEFESFGKDRRHSIILRNLHRVFNN